MALSGKNDGFWLNFTMYLLLFLCAPLILAIAFTCLIALGIVRDLPVYLWALLACLVAISIVVAFLLSKKKTIAKKWQASEAKDDIPTSIMPINSHITENNSELTQSDSGIADEDLNLKAQWLKSEFMRKFVTTKKFRAEFLKQAKELYGIDVKNKAFGILVFYSTHNEDDKEREISTAAVNRRNFQSFCDVARQTGDENFELHSFLIDHFIGCIVIFNNTEVFGYINPLKRLAKQIQRMVYTYYNIKVVGVCSDLVGSIKDLHTAYEECVEILSHKIVVENSAIPDEFLDVLKDIEVNLGIEKTQPITIKNIKDISNAKKAVTKPDKKDPEKTEEKKPKTAAKAKPAASTAKPAPAKAKPASKPAAKTVAKSAPKAAPSKKTDKSADENTVITAPAAANIDLITSVKQYIDGNYANKGLGTSVIAEQFKVSASDLQKSFKAKHKMNIPEYIQSCRIKKAKALMKKKNATVKDTADKVGYSSIKAFSDTFKKFENTTPGEYIESLRA